ncbi:hypothetical protein [Streptomyces sp. NPDC004065]|uniref:hypothetical protein n=1 Tax=Streptomyces sp. NPDC004065 TaxID=3364689 RepID=UPI00384F988F
MLRACRRPQQRTLEEHVDVGIRAGDLVQRLDRIEREGELPVRLGLQDQVLGKAEVVGAGLIRVDDALVGLAGCLESRRGQCWR